MILFSLQTKTRIAMANNVLCQFLLQTGEIPFRREESVENGMSYQHIAQTV